RPAFEESDSYWKPSMPCATIAHPVGDGFGFAHGAYLPDSSGPTGRSQFFGAEFRDRLGETGQGSEQSLAIGWKARRGHDDQRRGLPAPVGRRRSIRLTA